LWRYVENEDLVTVAAIVDGGDLAWKLTRVSDGLKTCSPKAIDPLTGEKLFNECATKLVQSRCVCFPLHHHLPILGTRSISTGHIIPMDCRDLTFVGFIIKLYNTMTYTIEW
jgi:hypothetical protein